MVLVDMPRILRLGPRPSASTPGSRTFPAFKQDRIVRREVLDAVFAASRRARGQSRGRALLSRDSDRTASDTIVRLTDPAPAIDESERLLEERLAFRRALADAAGRIPQPDLQTSLQAVADAVPAALSCDLVNIRVAADDRRLHCLAASGCTPTEIRARAFQPLDVARVREMVDSGSHGSIARSLGMRWCRVYWLVHETEAVATILIASRTLRRPGEGDLAFFDGVLPRIAAGIAAADRSQAAVSKAAVRLARDVLPEPSAPGPVEKLRPRERAILELLADGLSTKEIAEALVISSHTVRTHVKLALRRLGVHTREEAAEIVRAQQLAQLV
jgi:DNA-binding CsgD family transcriptional regulator